MHTFVKVISSYTIRYLQMLAQNNFICMLLLLAFIAAVRCKTLSHQVPLQSLHNAEVISVPAGKQLFLQAQGKETTPPDFVRLVVMRLIYGIASTMGLEDRLENVFNGVFVPPNADDDIFGFGGANDGSADDLSGILDDF